MAIHEFYCNDCRRDSELLLRGSDTPRCAHCGSENLERKISSFAIGSGSVSLSSCACEGSGGGRESCDCEPASAGSGGAPCGGNCGCGGH